MTSFSEVSVSSSFFKGSQPPIIERIVLISGLEYIELMYLVVQLVVTTYIISTDLES